MLLTPLLFNRYGLVAVLLMQIISYFLVLGKVGAEQRYAIIPFAAEWRLSKDLFTYMRAFYRPFVVTCILTAGAMYLNPFEGHSTTAAKLMLAAAIFFYTGFLFRLYRRLCKAFGRGLFYSIFTWLLPPLGLCILALGRAQYTRPVLKPRKDYGPILNFLGRAFMVVVSAAEVLALCAVVGIILIRTYPPRFVRDMLFDDVLAKIEGVGATGDVVTREESMGEAYASLASMPASREKFFPDHSQDKSVVVMTYIIGSDLEEKMGLASVNIDQMIEATKQGSALTFVLECGGSDRWFTKGVDGNSYGRYVIHDGKLEKVQDLDPKTCMSEPGELANFINWARDNYPADRNMLVFWDHGGGMGVGYGMDGVNKRDAELPMLRSNEIAAAVAQSNMKFDLIGFDACLMQDLGMAAVLEPYADYYLASEEVEGGFGWYYTPGFGMLAQNPGMATEDFGKAVIASFDPYNSAQKDAGEADTTSTLSLVDLPLAKMAYGQMEGFFGSARGAIQTDAASYANLSLSGTKSYTFANDTQVDLIDFLTRFDALDYEDKVYAHDQIESIVNAVKACVIYRNANSAEGINGMALGFPARSASQYTPYYQEFNAFSLVPQRDLYNDFFSIMVAQRVKAVKQTEADIEANGTEGINPLTYFSDLVASEMVNEEWYVQGFENYESQEALINIPLTEVANGYKPEMPDAAWDIIANSQVIAYQKADNGLLRYLGVDDIGNTDEAGHPLVAMDGTWPAMNGRLICYESGESRNTSKGVVFTGTTRARLNGNMDVTLNIGWDPVAGESDTPVRGHVVSYDVVAMDEGLFEVVTTLMGEFGEDVVTAFNGKAKMQLQPGDRIDFLFDYYNEQGELVETSTYGRTIVVTKPEGIYVSDEPLGECDIEFGGVFTDVYQRTMSTEKIQAHLSK